jgi:hypothetical protein
MSRSISMVFYCFLLASLAMATMGQNRFAMHDLTLMKNLNSYPHGVHPYFNYYYYNHQPFAENVQRQGIKMLLLK